MVFALLLTLVNTLFEDSVDVFGIPVIQVIHTVLDLN